MVGLWALRGGRLRFRSGTPWRQGEERFSGISMRPAVHEVGGSSSMWGNNLFMDSVLSYLSELRIGVPTI